MSPRWSGWDDVNARARGLTTHLLRRAQLEELGRAADLEHLVRLLEQWGYRSVPREAPFGAAATEAMVRREAARRLGLLARWCGPRAEILAVIFLDEDRRSLRALLRGAVASAPPDARLAGLIPTPALPLRALEELARLADFRAIGTLLAAWRHPFGEIIRTHAEPTPDLLRVEVDLAREFARRSLANAERGDRFLLRHASRLVDLENLWSALMLAESPDEVDPAGCFVPGGEGLPLARYLQAATADPADAGRLLAGAIGDPVLSVVIRGHRGVLVDLEDAALRAMLREARKEARIRPLGSAPVIGYALGVRAEVRDLQHLIWGSALGAPPATLAADLVVTA